MIEFILVYGLGVIMGTILDGARCPEKPLKTPNSSRVSQKKLKKLIDRSPYKPHEVLKNIKK